MPINEQLFCELRRKVIEQDFKRMNAMQKEAVYTVNGPVLVLAGAGSGKTTVIINRIANLIRYGDGYRSNFVPAFANESDLDFLQDYLTKAEHSSEEQARAIALCAVSPAKPWNIIAITFTNKAAGELKERLAAMLGQEDADAVWASTFHSSCVRILRRYIDRLGYDNHFTIYDTEESVRVIKDCMKEQNIDDKHFSPKSILTEISRGKNELLEPDDFSKKYDYDFRMRVCAGIYKSYQSRLRAANALDFDDIIMKSVQLLQTDEEVRSYYQNKFRYVMVDEYQDTNYSQYLLVSLLAGGYNNICVVGDDDQSIYRFRGATIENILNFEKQFQNTKVVRLEQNYRSTQNILDAANRVIEKNRDRKQKTLWTKNDGTEKITLYEASDDRNEALYIGNTILDMVQKQGMHFSDFAILYRINAQHILLKQTFFKMGLPHKIIKGNSLFDSKEFKDIRAYLCVIANNSDDARLKRIINEPKRGIGGTTSDLVEALGTSLTKSMLEVCGLAMQIDPLHRAADKLYQFYLLMQELTELKDTMPVNELIEAVIERTGYKKALELKNDQESATRIENLLSIVSYGLAYEQDNEENATLDGFLEEITLTESAADSTEQDAVSLMTVHSAKGLEFPVVFLYGVEENLFPSAMALSDESELEEERRLMYVAVTRAKKKLFMTRADSRILYGRTTANPPSRFIRDIPAELIETVAPPRPKSISIPQSHGTSRISQERSMFTGSRPTGQAAAPGAFAVGDTVAHPTFGKGMVISVKKMANDLFLEISFETVGTKKLMANFAKLTKL